MEEETTKTAPLPTIRRLPTYLSYLRRLRTDGCQTVSGTRISQDLGLDSIQIRKDLAFTGIVGKPGVGFDVANVIQNVERFLGWDNSTDAFLIGAGSLGTALMGYEGFQRYGLSIVAAFDNHPSKIGKMIRGKQVLPMEKLPDLVDRMHIHLGILAVPGEVAQRVAEELVQSGIMAIWNFAPATLKLPPEIIVQNTELSSELAVLSVMLRHARRKAMIAEEMQHPDHPPSCSSETRPS